MASTFFIKFGVILFFLAIFAVFAWYIGVDIRWMMTRDGRLQEAEDTLYGTLIQRGFAKNISQEGRTRILLSTYGGRETTLEIFDYGGYRAKKTIRRRMTTSWTTKKNVQDTIVGDAWGRSSGGISHPTGGSVPVFAQAAERSMKNFVETYPGRLVLTADSLVWESYTSQDTWEDGEACLKEFVDLREELETLL